MKTIAYIQIHQCIEATEKELGVSTDECRYTYRRHEIGETAWEIAIATGRQPFWTAYLPDGDEEVAIAHRDSDTLKGLLDALGGLVDSTDCIQFETAMSGELFVIHSVSDRGFWSNETGWGNVASATSFNQSEMRTMELPLSSKNDAHWVTASEAMSLCI